MFDLLDVPLFGREEDAADQFSAMIMLHFSKTEARRLILGTAYAYNVEVEGATEETGMTDFADEHGTPAQRFYNLLCVAYGAEPELFADIVKKGYLPNDRAEGCEDEYALVDRTAYRRGTPEGAQGPRPGAQLAARPDDPGKASGEIEIIPREMSAGG
jgi:hypothetical protein